jgi:hypothetical protein
MNGPPANAVYAQMLQPSRQFVAPNGGPSHFNTAQQVAPNVMGVSSRRNVHQASSRSMPMHVVAANDNDKATNRSQLLDEFRNSRLPQLQLSDLTSHVVEFSKDQHGQIY